MMNGDLSMIFTLNKNFTNYYHNVCKGWEGRANFKPLKIIKMHGSCQLINWKAILVPFLSLNLVTAAKRSTFAPPPPWKATCILRWCSEVWICWTLVWLTDRWKFMNNLFQNNTGTTISSYIINISQHFLTPDNMQAYNHNYACKMDKMKRNGKTQC